MSVSNIIVTVICFWAVGIGIEFGASRILRNSSQTPTGRPARTPGRKMEIYVGSDSEISVYYFSFVYSQQTEV
ncbi:uncharacterized protein GGS22DRAFT_108299 [Annulohypoxylon maeteangense]|uniref:uncharacterized protein n=1 Tax=Annulohypoxylon maeteangense TaxID=1927788 RepID=UPI002007A997|nr:uncharacterized protein GGS22DRAFT_108299 [Annulohypoxylon maeteangense]KAI0887369.1 hypothetical protein GGS22DRAFT_108299 [Annulohypoxylon maeteangense]